MQKALQRLQELADQQQKKIQRLADSRGYCLTDEDLLQPNDFPHLESDPEFRYEEGVREGIWSAIAFLRAFQEDEKFAPSSLDISSNDPNNPKPLG